MKLPPDSDFPDGHVTGVSSLSAERCCQGGGGRGNEGQALAPVSPRGGTQEFELRSIKFKKYISGLRSIFLIQKKHNFA